MDRRIPISLSVEAVREGVVLRIEAEDGSGHQLGAVLGPDAQAAFLWNFNRAVELARKLASQPIAEGRA